MKNDIKIQRIDNVKIELPYETLKDIQVLLGDYLDHSENNNLEVFYETLVRQLGR